MHLVALRHKCVHEPVPVVGGLDDDADDLFLVRLQRIKDNLTIVRKLLLENSFAVLILNAKICVA